MATSKEEKTWQYSSVCQIQVTSVVCIEIFELKYWKISLGMTSLHYKRHPAHPLPSEKVIPSPEGFTLEGAWCRQFSDFPSLLLFLPQTVDWFKLMISRFSLFFFFFLHDSLICLGHSTTFTFRDFVCVKIHYWCLLCLSAATPPHTALFIVGHPSILSNTPQLSSMRRSSLSAGRSHHRMHIPYSIYPRVRCLMVSLSLLAQFGKILTLSDLEKSHCRIMTNIIHIRPSYRWSNTRSRQRTSKRSFWRKSGILHDYHCPVLLQELFLISNFTLSTNSISKDFVEA